MYIVGEYLFLENLIINYLILQSTKKITKTKTKKTRIILTSILSALYPFILFFPSLIFLTGFFIKLILSMLIVKIAFNSKSFRLFIKQLSAFYIISFIFAGGSIGFYYFINNYHGIIFKNILVGFPVKYLILGVMVGNLLIKSVMYYFNEKVIKEKELINVNISINNRNSVVTALNDTGNSLIEPISKLPVFVVEYKTIEGILAQSIKEILNNTEVDFIKLEKYLEESNDLKLKLIPFKSIGKDNGILLGLKPDYIEINDNELKRYKSLLIGIYVGNLSTDDQYSGLLNIDMLKEGV